MITQDYSYHKNENEMLAIKQYEIGCFYLWGANATKWEIMKAFVRAHDKMMAVVASQTGPYIYRIGRTGRLSKLKLPA